MRRESVGSVRALQVSLSFALLLPVPVSEMPRHRPKAAAEKRAWYAPAPPAVHYQQGYAPGITPETAAGTAAYDRDTNTIYYQGKRMDAAVRAHETGHAFDDQVLSDGDRAYFQRLMHAPAGDWRTGTGLQGLASPNEWFADYYQAAALNLDPRHQSEASYAQVGPKRLKRFERALARLAERRGIKQQYL